MPWLLRQRLQTNLIGKRIYSYKKIKSTQKLALSLAEKNPTSRLDGTIIIAERQRNSTGRAGRRWISPVGGIWLSVILNPNLLSSQSMLIMFLATLSVCEVLKSETGLNPKIKWPNDVIISGRKVCGILVDIAAINETMCYAVIGLGINVNNEPMKIISELSKTNGNCIYGVTSIKKELGGLNVSIVDITGSLIQRLDHYYHQLQQGFHHNIIRKWKCWSEYFNKAVLIKEHNRVFEATVEDIDVSGTLVVRTLDGKTRKVSSQDIVLEREPTTHEFTSAS
jgi:BirA family transcriptional regulator, biotin operon repressor / biotin---[acetyl-CoA-carboxylase] ligase